MKFDRDRVYNVLNISELYEGDIADWGGGNDKDAGKVLVLLEHYKENLNKLTGSE